MIRCAKDGPDPVKTDSTDKGYLGISDGAASGFSGGGSSGGIRRSQRFNATGFNSGRTNNGS